MVRVQIPILAQDGDGTAISGASVDIVNRETGQPPTVYQSETGGATRSLPLTTGADGRPPASWVARAPYTITITAAAIGIWIEAWDAAAAKNQGVDGAWLDPAGAVRAAAPPIVTALPVDPVDGDEIRYLADAAKGVVWPLKYRAGSPSAYKWEAFGALPLSAQVAAEESTTLGNLTWQDLVTAGPSVTLPLAGDYWGQYGADLYSFNNPAQILGLMGIGFNGANPPSVNSTDVLRHLWRTNSNQIHPKTKQHRINGVPAGVAKARYARDQNVVAFSDRWLALSPIRVG